MLVEFVEKKLRQEQLVQAGQSVAVALSGGRDSVCLLHILKELAPRLPFRLSAVHIHHGLRTEADADEAFCRQLCQSWQIPLQVYRVDVPSRVRETGETVEEAARVLRYEAFETLIREQGAERIALAHHQQDQAETVLLHLLRGSALTGLCGMQPRRLPYIRPLLEVPRAEIEAYISRHGLSYVEDASNQDTAYRRNHIRRQLLPLLQQEYNPEIVRTLAQMAAQLQEEEAYLESLVPEVPADGLSVEWLHRYPINLQKRILRRWLKEKGLRQDVQQIHVQKLLDLAKGQTGRSLSLPKGLTVEKTYDILNIHRSIPNPALSQGVPVLSQGFPSFTMEWIPIQRARQEWDSPDVVPALPEEKWLRADELRQPVWRTRRPGDYIMAAGGRKKLKDFMIDEKIPRAERESLPLLADGAHVLWVYGYRISDGVKITQNTQRVLHVRRI